MRSCVAVLLIGGALLGCATPRLPPHSQVLQSFGESSEQQLPSTVSVLVWNLYKGQREGWRDDMLGLGKRADLIMVQEAVTTQDMLEVLQTLPSVRWQYAQSFSYSGLEHSTGVATGASTSPLEVQFIRSIGREPLAGTPKMALLTTYPMAEGGSPLLAVNVHGHLAVSYEAFTRQMERIAEQVAAHRGPVVWAGDFNTWSVARYEAVRVLAKRLEMTPVEFVPERRTRVLGKILDHAFVRGLEVFSSRALRNVESSDHVPLMLELRRLTPARTSG